MIHERKETKEDSPDFLSEGNFLTRHMEWRKTKHKMKVKVGFPRQEHWSGLPFPFPEDLSCPVVDPVSPAPAGRFFITEPPGKPEVTDLLTALSDPSASLITYYPPAIRKNTLCQFS